MALSQAHADLKTRCLMCLSNGFKIGKAAAHVTKLQAEVGEPTLPQGMVVNSAAHLLLLLGMLEKGEFAVTAPKATPKPAPAPIVTVVEVEEAVEEPVASIEAQPEAPKPSKKNRR
jgi:hypothetical protein